MQFSSSEGECIWGGGGSGSGSGNSGNLAPADAAPACRLSHSVPPFPAPGTSPSGPPFLDVVIWRSGFYGLFDTQVRLIGTIVVVNNDC